MNPFGIIATAALVVYTLGAIALVILRRRRRTSAPPLGRRPRISILKPLKGLDDGLRENLASFFAIDYPDFEIIFGASEESDPAIGVARSLAGRNPHVPVTFSIGSSAVGTNPKVRNLIEMIKRARGEFIVVSDSNTRVDRDYLTKSIDYFSDPDLALVSHFLAGRGERSTGAILEHLHIGGYIAPAQAFATIYARITPIIGKSMIIRRRHLDEVGGVGGLADYLAEDYLLGRKLAETGRKVMFSPWTVTNYNSTTSIPVFCMRHYRWLAMRWRINPWSCILELLTIPLLWNFLWLVSGTGPVTAPLAVYTLHTLIQQAVITYTREGEPLPAISILLSPIKDILHLCILIPSMIGNRVEWRGNHYEMGWLTKMTPIEPPRRLLDPAIFSARLGDAWPFEGRPGMTPLHPR